MLDFQTTQVSFRYGIDEGTDPKSVPFGTLTTCRNLIWKKAGRLEQRFGLRKLTKDIIGGGTLAAGARLFTREDELCLITGSAIYSHATAGWKLAGNLGQLSDVGLTWETIQSGYLGVQASDVGITSDEMLVHAWVTGTSGVTPATGRLFYQVIDRATGARTTTATELDVAATPKRVRVITSGTSWAIVFDDGTKIRCSVNGGTIADLAVDGKTGGAAFDAKLVNSHITIAYALNAGGIGLKAYSFVAIPALMATDTVTGEAGAITAIAIDGIVSEPLWIGYFVSGGSTAFMLATADASNLTQILSPVPVDAVYSSMSQPTVTVRRYDATHCLYVYSTTQNGTAYEDGFTLSMKVDSSGLFSTARITWNVVPLSAPFQINGKWHLFVGRFMTAAGYDTTVSTGFNNSSTHLIEIEPLNRSIPHRLVGKSDFLTGGAWVTGHVSNVVSVSSTEYVTIMPTFATAPTGFGSWLQACSMVDITSGASAPEDLWRSVAIGPETYLAAGVLQAYDGRMAFDYGWSSDTPFNQHWTFAATGGLIADGSYVYQAAPEYRSAAGVLHRGPANKQRLATFSPSADTNKVTLRVVPATLSQKFCDTGAAYASDPIPPEIVVFRSTVGESVPQRLSVEPNYNIVIQAFDHSPMTLEDTRNDGNIGTASIFLSERPAIYTESGELDDFQPPAFLTMCEYRGRIFGIGGDRRTIWFSKAQQANPGIAPGFNAALRLLFDEDLTGLAVIDDRLIIFSAEGIQTLTGDGPTQSGDNSDFLSANRIQTDRGCTNARSICSGPDGIYFEADGSLYLLTRKLEVVWMGKRVQDLLDAYPVITSAVIVASQNQVRFSANAADGESGIVLVYNTAEDQWSHFTYAGGVAIADALLHPRGTYCFVTPAGQVYEEDVTTYLDEGAGSGFVTTTIETAEVFGDGPLSYDSMRNFMIDGASNSDHYVLISVAFNGSTTYQQGPKLFAPSLAGVTSPGPVTAKISIGTRRKARSVRFKIETSGPMVLGNDGGISWSAMALEIGKKQGLGRLKSTQTG